MQIWEEEKPSVFETEAVGKVEIDKEESEISLQLPANKQASSDLHITNSEENKMSQNTCLLESVSEKIEHVFEETSTDNPVDKKGTVEDNRVVTEKSKESVSDPSKENPGKMQNESILLGEDVEAKKSRAQNTVLMEDFASQKEGKEADTV
ncbi:UNVERIFIED_CONTAM: hypothetical protein K2H54_001693 [Gekko kuhli]